MALDETTQQELAQKMLELSSNPKTRKSLLKLLKEQNPNQPIPEIDVEDQINARLGEAEKKYEEKINKFEQDRLQESLSKQRLQAMQDNGLSEDQMKSMEEMMTKGELPMDYKFAPKLFKQQIEPAGATTYQREYGPVEMPSGEGLMENEHRWSLSEAHKTVDELLKRGQRPF